MSTGSQGHSVCVGLPSGQDLVQALQEHRPKTQLENALLQGLTTDKLATLLPKHHARVQALSLMSDALAVGAKG